MVTVPGVVTETRLVLLPPTLLPALVNLVHAVLALFFILVGTLTPAVAAVAAAVAAVVAVAAAILADVVGVGQAACHVCDVTR